MQVTLCDCCEKRIKDEEIIRFYPYRRLKCIEVCSECNEKLEKINETYKHKFNILEENYQNLEKEYIEEIKKFGIEV